MSITVFWVVTPGEDEGDMFPRNVGKDTSGHNPNDQDRYQNNDWVIK
jgi:hypothetical protein